MKRLILLALLIVSSISCNQLVMKVEAQTLPVTKTAQWDPNPASEVILYYTFQYDSTPSINVPPAIDASCSCISTPFVISSTGNHQLSVTAVNFWGNAATAVLSFNVSIPGKSTNIRIK